MSQRNSSLSSPMVGKTRLNSDSDSNDVEIDRAQQFLNEFFYQLTYQQMYLQRIVLLRFPWLALLLNQRPSDGAISSALVPIAAQPATLITPEVASSPIIDGSSEVNEPKSPESRQKRIRTAFSSRQLARLEQAFQMNSYAVGNQRRTLAYNLNLTEAQIKVWFQNRRTKQKRLKFTE